jgi:hypothetical protein
MFDLRPEIWGSHYWFFLYTVAFTYPSTPNSITKRKYYDLIMNFPLFIPDIEMGDKFAQMLDEYPVSPYLDNRDSFLHWVHFIHNKYNKLLGKDEISFQEGIDRYIQQYREPEIIINETFRINRRVITLCLIVVFLLIIYYLYNI